MPSFDKDSLSKDDVKKRVCFVRLLREEDGKD